MSTTPPPPPPPNVPPPPPGGGVPPPPGGGYGGPWPVGGFPVPSGPKPPNHLVWAILATLFCCLPFGIVSIVYAAQVDSKFNAGDHAGAVATSDNARKWAIVSAVAGVAIAVIYVLFVVALASGTS